MNIFWKEFKNFCKSNWWIFLIFFVCLVIIYKTESWNVFEIFFVFLLHFLWDLFVMMMGAYMVEKKYKEASISQVFSSIIFLFLWIYAWLFSWKWIYLLTSFPFLLTTCNGYFKNIKVNSIYKFFDYRLLIFINVIILIIEYCLWIINSFHSTIQALWFAIFSTSLVINNDKIKYFTWLTWIWFIALGSWFTTYFSFLANNVKWIDVSYFLLPLTVFVFYFKNIKRYL